MKQGAILLFLSIFIFSACGPVPTAEPTPDIQATAKSVSGTMVAGTLTAQPTATQPPTNTPEPTQTSTAIPTATIYQTPTATPTQIVVATPTPWTGSFGDPNENRTGLLLIENMTGEKEIIVSMEGVSLIQNTPFYIAYVVNGNMKIMIPWARYKYTIQIPNKKTFTGTFTQNNKDKTTMRIKMQQVDIIGP